MVELPKTQEELETLIAESVNAKVEELSKKHNDEMANLRTKHKKEFDDFKAKQTLSDEERAKVIAEEHEKELNDELNDLRAFKKKSVLEAKLEKEGLPKWLSNDNRLLSAEDGDIDKVLKNIKTEFGESLPKGNTHSSVVPTQTNPTVPSGDKKEQAYQSGASFLENLFK